MEDSSANPYIPQESENIRQKVSQRQSPLGRIVKWSAIATGVVALLVGVGLFFVIPRTSAIDQQARIKLADALQPPDQTLKRVSVESTIGFKLNYDNRVYSSYAEVGDSTAGSDNSLALATGQTYENNDLRVTRAYNYVRIRPVESVDTSRALSTIPPQLEIYATVNDKDLSAAQAVPENKGQSKLSLFVKLDSDKRLAKRVADDKTVVSIDATKPVKATINGVDYQKVRYTTSNDNHRVSNVKYDDCYYTITDYNQPYSICISNVRPTNVSAASLVEAVFNSIVFEQPSGVSSDSSTTAPAAKGTKDTSKKTSFLYPLARLTQATTTTNTTSDSSNGNTSADASDAEGQSPLLTITPSYYSDASSLSAIAVNQPSVVRVGTLYCADLDLKFESGETATSLTDACVGNVATGVFVSKDGYIATTGHAIQTQKKAAINGYINFAPDQDSMLDRLQRILDYLLKAKIILQSDADYLKTGASIGDQEALAKVENIASVIPDKFITPVREDYTYAVQPTDKPIVINRNDSLKPSFAYSDSVLKAKYVASDYDASKSIQEVFGSATPTVDVGLLKLDGDYPEVPVAASENMKGGDTLNIIGYPAYADSSLTIDKIRNLPVATVTKVDQAYQKDGTRLIQTDKPMLPGNDGAPVFDSSGKLVGFAVYGLSYCPDQSCFSNGTVRSSSELLNLLKDNNIKLTSGNQSIVNWKNGVAEYMRANYTASAGDFALAGTQYGFNRWADPIHKLAVAAQGTPNDTSFMNLLQTIMIVVLILLIVVTILLAVAWFVQRRRSDMLLVGHYGAASPAVATVTPITAPVPTQAPPVSPYEQPNVQAQSPEIPKQDESPVLPIRERSTPAYQPDVPEQPAQPQPPTPPAPQSPPAGGRPEDPFYK